MTSSRQTAFLFTDDADAPAVTQPAFTDAQTVRRYCGIDHDDPLTHADLTQVEDRLRWRQSRRGRS